MTATPVASAAGSAMMRTPHPKTTTSVTPLAEAQEAEVAGGDAMDGFFIPSGGSGSVAAAAAAYALGPAIARIPILSILRGSDRGDLKTTLFILDAPPSPSNHPIKPSDAAAHPTRGAAHYSAASFPRAMYLVERISAALQFPFFVDMEKPLTMELLEARVAERMRRVSSNHTWFWLRPVVRFFPLGLRKTEVSLIENTCVRAERQDNRVTFIVYIHDQVPVTIAFLEKLKHRSSLSRSANIVVLAHQESLQRGGVGNEELQQFHELVAYDVHHLPWAGSANANAVQQAAERFSACGSVPWYSRFTSFLLPKVSLHPPLLSLETWHRWAVEMCARLYLTDAVHAIGSLRRN